MSIFKRKFEVAALAKSVNANPWLTDLLGRWQPAGSPGARTGLADRTDEEGLRLAVRDRYLNFYKRGQSVAKVNFDPSHKPQSRIHRKYVSGEAAKTGPDYVAVNATGYVDRSGQTRSYAGPTELDSWIDAAKKKGGTEKTFVDRVVDHNANIVDLEMTLSAEPVDEEKRKALRMDLVALEPDGHSFRVVFWEVKLADDGRSKREGNLPPEVFKQIGNYVKWLDRPENREHVIAAYTETCRVLVGMHVIARSINPAIGDLGAAILAIASDAATLTVDPKPRLLIYDPRKASKFKDNGHLEKLLKLGHHVQHVQHEDVVTLDIL